MADGRTTAYRSGSISSSGSGSTREDNTTVHMYGHGSNQVVYVYDLSSYQYYKIDPSASILFFSWRPQGLSDNFDVGVFQYTTDSALSRVGSNGSKRVTAPVNFDVPYQITVDVNGFGNFTDWSKVASAISYGGSEVVSLPGDGTGYNSQLFFTYEKLPPLAPDTLNPNNTNRNPKAPLALSWAANLPEEPGVTQDTVKSTTLQYRVNGGGWSTVQINSKANQYSFNANRFQAGDKIEWRVATEAVHNGLGPYSKTAVVTMAATAPSQSNLIYPVDVRIRGEETIGLEWVYNSPYDNKPTRFDIEWQMGNGPWQTGSTSGETTYIIPGSGESVFVSWRVKAYGELADEGPWSETANFYIIAKPEKPVIVDITNSAKPEITFYADMISLWQIQILSQGKAVYDTGQQHYMDYNVHPVDGFLDNGQYVARIKVWNEFGYESDWGALAFTIDVEKPAPPEISVVANNGYGVRLYYRSGVGENYLYRDGMMIAALSQEGVYDDYLAEPFYEHIYFVRAMAEDHGFSDSGKVTGSIRFWETAFSLAREPEKCLLLSLGYGGNPEKEETVESETARMQMTGKEYDVVEFGPGKSRMFQFQFYVSKKQWAQLEQLKLAKSIVCLRDKDLGVHFGYIGSIVKDKTLPMDGYLASFSFVKTQYNPYEGVKV